MEIIGSMMFDELPIVNDPCTAHLFIDAPFWIHYPEEWKGMVVVNKTCLVRCVLIAGDLKRVFICGFPVLHILDEE